MPCFLAGQEFRAKKVQSLMKQHNIRYFPTQNETKASTSERAILTIKMRLRRWFTYKEDYAYVPVLQQFADSYNETFHRTIGMAPDRVTKDNEMEVRLSTYFTQRNKRVKRSPKLRPFKYKIGDHVRITHLRQAFTRAYDETYSGEVFQVHKRYHRGALPIYKLRDLQNEDITGTFYESELQRVDVDPNQMWKVEKVLKTRGFGRNKQYFVKWKYYPAKFNSWVDKLE